MAMNEHQKENQSGLLNSLRRVFGKLFGKSADSEQHISDDKIRQSIHGRSATSTYQKPDLKKND
jgi:hypothetical protein